MAKQSTIYQVVGSRFLGQTFQPSDTTTIKQVAPAGINDSLVKSILITNNDTSDAEVSLYINQGGTDYLIDTIKVVSGSGFDGTHPGVDGLANAALPLDVAGKKFCNLPAGTFLRASVGTTVGSGKTVTVSAQLQDY